MLRGSEDHNMSEFTVLTAYTSSTKTLSLWEGCWGVGGGGGAEEGWGVGGWGALPLRGWMLTQKSDS